MKRFSGLLAFVMVIMSLSACKNRNNMADNPFFESEWTTPYGVPPFDRIRFEHYKPAFEQGMSLHNEEIARIVESSEEPTFENTILAFDNSGQMLSRVSTVFGMLEAAETNEQMQDLSAEIMPQLAAHSDSFLMNEKLFDRVKSVYERREALKLDDEQKRLTEKIYNSFVRSGALLSAENKNRLKQINEKLSSHSVTFGRNLLSETNDYVLELTREDVVGVPGNVRDAAMELAKSKGKESYMFTLHEPSRIPLLTYAKKRSVREAIFKAYIARGNNGNEYDNKSIVAEMAQLRCEKAKLLGYDSYAEYVTSDEMAGSAKAVYELLEGVWNPALEKAKQELARMEAIFAREEGKDAKFEAWDWWYYAEKLRKSEYNLEEETVRQYLSLDNVKSGIFFLANRLYNITFRPLKAPSYHQECEAYEVLDNDDKVLGVLYFDFHPRAGKSGGAWCGTYVDQTYKDGKRVCPVVSIVCNFTRPTGGVPALLSIDETKTLFHEFGHALHNLFADVKYRGLANVEGDFVELPSQIMENWAFAPELLRQYAVHYRTSEVIPNDIIEKIGRASTFNEGFAVTELVAAALADMDIHSLQGGEKIDVMEFERKALTEKRGLIPQIEPRYHYTYFSHIFNGGYSSGYYFYIWAEVLDKDAYQAFIESGDLFSSDVAARFRSEILSKGGTRKGMDMYRAFRGADPNKLAMLVARGLVDKDDVALTEPLANDVEVGKIVKVDTRAQARERAERSRRERAEAKMRADSAALADSLAKVDEQPSEM
ncbi:MAG: M3 family metallopeptidase [Alistipes sp.]|nr:M3 family metallopeptidase [Alistipes sp.]